MHEQRGSFNGIDTCNINSYRKFNFNSKLLSEFESTSIINRPDVNSLLNQLVEEHRLTKYIVDGKRVHAQEIYGDFNFKKYFIGATHVPFEVAMSI